MKMIWLLLLPLFVLLGACSSSERLATSTVPLAEDRPTLLFFFTDN